MMNYKEFKNAICVQCGNNCAAGYGCDFTEAYKIYLTLLDKVNDLVSRRDRVLHFAELEEKAYQYRQQRWPDLDDDYELRNAERYRAKAASLQIEIDAKRKEIDNFITLK